MFPRFASKSFGLVALAAALTISFSHHAVAQSSGMAAVGARSLVTAPVDDKDLVTYKNSVPASVKTAIDQGEAASSMPMEGHLVLRRPEEMQKAVDLLEKRLRTPGDPLYHQWLTEQELAESFAPAQSDIEALQTWMEGHGLTLLNYQPSQLLVQFTGAVGSVEEAFHTSIHDYQVEDGSVHYANATNPKAPAALAKLLFSPFRLDDFEPIHTPNFAGRVVGGKVSAATEAGHIENPEAISNANPALTVFTLADTPGNQNQGTSAAQTLTLTVTGKSGDGPPFGSVAITGSGAIGAITTYTFNATTPAGCTKPVTYGWSCTYTWNPAAGLATAAYTLTAAYTGMANSMPITYANNSTTTAFTVDGTTADSTAVSAAPTLVDAGTPSTTVTSITTWTGAGATPTGTVTLSCGSGSAGTCINLPAPVNVSSCSISAPSKTITCSIPYALDSNDSLTDGVYNMTMTYSGDTTYAGSSAAVAVTDSADITPTGSLSVLAASVTYGTATSVTFTANIKGNATGGVRPTGTITLTEPTLGTVATITIPTNCTNNGTLGYSCTANYVVPAATAVAVYTVTENYSGDLNYGPLSTATTTLTVTQATVTAVMSSPKGAGVNQESDTYGALIAFPVSGTVTWSGTGTAPTVGDITFIPTAPGAVGTVTCMGSSSPYSCSATFTPTATDAVNTYAVNISFSGDTNYSSAVSAQTQNYAITPATPTLVLTPGPVASTYGSTTAITITATATGVAGGTTPGGVVTFTTKAAVLGTLSPTTCTLVSGVCTVMYTPSATQAVGNVANGFSATEAANGNYTASAVANRDLRTTQQTPTVAVTTVVPASVVYGSATPSTVTATLTYTGGGAAPTGTPMFTNTTAAGNFGTVSCGSPSGDVITCTVTFTPTTADAIGTYTITANYAGDTNYNNASSSGTNNYSITGATPTLVLTPGPVTSAYGVTTPITITATATGVAGGTTPGGVVTFTTKAAVLGTLSSSTCTLSGGVCTVSYTPSASQAVGNVLKGFSATEAANGNYTASAAATRDLMTTQQTPVVAVPSVSPASSVYGSATPSTVTATITYSGSGTAPSGTPTFSPVASGTFTGESCGAPSGDVITCTVTFTPATNDAVGTYTIAASYAGDTNYATAASTQTNNYTVTIATATLAMVAGTPGTTTTGVTSTTLVATLSPAAPGATVTFTDVTTGATIGSATTIANGTATITVNSAGTGSGQSSMPSGGKNLFSASVGATTNTTAASTTSNTTTYYQGILFSTVGPHDFSGLITDGSQTVEGTVDGTRLGPFGVSVYNFTTTAQALPLTLTNAASGAFSVVNQCINPMPAGGVCSFNFYYAPPAGDGCNPNLTPPPAGGGCTLDGSSFPQGTFESAPWSVAVASGILTGIGDQQFDRSGAATPAGTLEGKAILAPGMLNVSSLMAAFGSVAQNATSPTLTIVVSNTSNAAVPFTYTGLTTSNFTVNNTCNTGTSGTLAANASCNIYLTMVTSATGSFSDSLTITPSGGVTSTVAISGTVALTSTGITLSSNNHNFGNITDGTSVGFSTTLTNNTGGAASLSFSNSAGAGYTTSTNCGASLAANASCVYGFTFAPTTPGASTDTLTITSDVPILPGSGGDTATVTVSGTGVVGGHLTATSVTHNWGSLALGTSGGNYGVEITNSTSSAVTLSFSGLTGGSSGFKLVSSTCGSALAVNANCELIFSFTPVATGFVTGTYPITSSSPLFFSGSAVSPEQITLEGTGD